MKKIYLILFSLIFSSFFSFSQEYKIIEVNYDVSQSSWHFLGTTKTYALNQNIKVDKEKIFSSLEELDEYINYYKQQLANLRAFEEINVEYEILTTLSEHNNIKLYGVKINSSLTDSLHLLAMPYGKYNSNSGAVFKLKIKDSNFLGSLNALSGDLNFALKQQSELDAVDYSLGFNFSFDYPFKASIFDCTWINDHAFSYTFGNELPEWNFETGLEVSFPLKRMSINAVFSQYVINNYDYQAYGDAFYFKEYAKISTPMTLAKIDNWGGIYYSPYICASYCWDLDGISNLRYNYSLAGPNLEFGNGISTSNVNWNNNLRTGVSLSLQNSYQYNFDRNMLYPVISFDSSFFKNFDIYDGNWFSRFGMAAKFNSFFYFIDRTNKYFESDGSNIGGYLRGIRDNQTFPQNGWSVCQTISALILNLDMPIHIYSTNFTQRFINYFNFELQINPFVDIALTYNKITKNWFNLKDGFYTAGFEVLVFPKKWSNYTVRGSLGVDIGRLILSDKINMDWRPDISKYEVSFGLGLHY